MPEIWPESARESRLPLRAIPLRPLQSGRAQRGPDATGKGAILGAGRRQHRLEGASPALHRLLIPKDISHPLSVTKEDSGSTERGGKGRSQAD